MRYTISQSNSNAPNSTNLHSQKDTNLSSAKWEVSDQLRFDGAIMGIETGQILGFGYNFIVVVSANAVNMYGSPEEKVDIGRMKMQAKQECLK